MGRRPEELLVVQIGLFRMLRIWSSPISRRGASLRSTGFLRYWIGFPDNCCFIEKGKRPVSQEFQGILADTNKPKICYDTEVFDSFARDLRIASPEVANSVTPTRKLLWANGCLSERSDEDAVAMLLFGTGIWPYDTVAEYEKRFRLNFRDPEGTEYQLQDAFPLDLDRPEEGSHAPRVPPGLSALQILQRWQSSQMYHHVERQCRRLGPSQRSDCYGT